MAPVSPIEPGAGADFRVGVEFEMKGMHIAITGASERIGRAIALECARHGARVTLSARSRDKLEAVSVEITNAHGVATPIPADVASEAECRALMEEASAVNGPIDVLICNAGIGSAVQGGELISIDTIRRTMEVNFMGSRACDGSGNAVAARDSGSHRRYFIAAGLDWISECFRLRGQKKLCRASLIRCASTWPTKSTFLSFRLGQWLPAFISAMLPRARRSRTKRSRAIRCQ